MLRQPVDEEARPLCCGRTFLAVGLVDEARKEAERVLAALDPYLARGVPVVGLEPSCILGFRDEIPAIIPGDASQRLAANALLFEEFLAREAQAGRLKLALRPVARQALLHGHCHQKSFGAMGAVEATLKLVPGLDVETVDSSCCGMAGSFGYRRRQYRCVAGHGRAVAAAAGAQGARGTLVVADGTSCRHQIQDGAGREAIHVARVLAMSVAAARGI